MSYRKLSSRVQAIKDVARTLYPIKAMLMYFYHDCELLPWTAELSDELFDVLSHSCVRFPKEFAFCFYERPAPVPKIQGDLLDIVPYKRVVSKPEDTCPCAASTIAQIYDIVETRARDAEALSRKDPEADTLSNLSAVDLVATKFAARVLERNAKAVCGDPQKAIELVYRASQTEETCLLELLEIFLETFYFRKGIRASKKGVAPKMLPLLTLAAMIEDASANCLPLPIYPHAPRSAKWLGPRERTDAETACVAIQASIARLYSSCDTGTVQRAIGDVVRRFIDVPELAGDEPQVPRTYLNILMRLVGRLCTWVPDYAQATVSYGGIGSPDFPLEARASNSYGSFIWHRHIRDDHTTPISGSYTNKKVLEDVDAAVRSRQASDFPLRAFATFGTLDLVNLWRPSGKYHTDQVLYTERGLFNLILHAVTERMDTFRPGTPFILVYRKFRGYHMLVAALLIHANLAKEYEPAEDSEAHVAYQERKRLSACAAVGLSCVASELALIVKGEPQEEETTEEQLPQDEEEPPKDEIPVPEPKVPEPEPEPSTPTAVESSVPKETELPAASSVPEESAMSAMDIEETSPVSEPQPPESPKKDLPQRGTPEYESLIERSYVVPEENAPAPPGYDAFPVKLLIGK